MSQNNERIVSSQKLATDDTSSPMAINLRPSSLDEFVGQDKVCQNLKVFIQSAKSRGEVLDHVLLYGPPGLGKTTLSNIISKELGVGFKATSAPMITRSGDLAAILTNLEARDVLFIDEIHRLNPAIEEVLYSAMEDFQLDIIIGEGPSARSVKIDLQPFTLVGATTRSGLVSTPLRERFGIPLRMDFYNHEDLQKIVLRGATLLNMPISQDGAMEIAKRSRGTPRIAGRLLKRVRDFGAVAGNIEIDSNIADKALSLLDVDPYGLDEFDRRYLNCIAKNYGGGPVGADTLAAALSEERDTIEEVIEPYLLKLGLKNLIFCDRQGIIYDGMEGLNVAQQEVAKISNLSKQKGLLKDALVGADLFIGVSGPNLVTKEMISTMANDAIVFPLANPTPEITREEALLGGARIIGTGSSKNPNQINNVLVFPGIFRGALDCRATDINEEMKVAAAKAIASLVSDEELKADYIIPSPFDKRVAPAVAKAVKEAAIKTGVNRI